MPRGPRLDAPGALQHLMARGIERSLIFRDDDDRDALLARIAKLVEARAWEILAWALMPNHFHLLARTGDQPISRSMRRLLTGYAVHFNRRHDRAGHLFQNRFKSVVCDEDAYLLELVRYLHLNPVRAGLLPSAEALDDYPYTGHSAVIGRYPRAWQSTRTVLRFFGSRRADALDRYGAFIRAGALPDLEGGGLIRSNGKWAARTRLRRGREAHAADERILGGPEFVARILQEAPAPERTLRGSGASAVDLEALTTCVCDNLGVDANVVVGRRRSGAGLLAREAVSYLWVEALGLSGRVLADRLGWHRTSVYKAARRGGRSAERWRNILRRYLGESGSTC